MLYLDLGLRSLARAMAMLDEIFGRFEQHTFLGPARELHHFKEFWPRISSKRSLSDLEHGVKNTPIVTVVDFFD